MNPQFDRCVAFVIDALEGGAALTTDLGGGLTKWGIASKAHPKLDVARLTREEAIEIYDTDYFMAAGCERLDYPMSLVVFSAAVNQGVTFAKGVSANSLDHLEALWECFLHYVEIANKHRE